ncbi:uncharacterized protein LOC117589213 [Drosophila guanche]|uniref:Uncharacterized protein n=1 Tax=Drosophila guanche TaxID=7266 RepID=A0A3B0KUB0_DROGU|nr:uncharacterized protein LOC117589213 [Drosophila guanche]SPP87528.1 Hypothetical predicted protein [Drosophila guanche]
MDPGNDKSEANCGEALILPEEHSFHDGIKVIAECGEIDEGDADWLLDAQVISRTIREAMSEKDLVYNFMLQNLLATATFYRGSKIDFPLRFDQYLRFRMPFRVTPIFNTAQPAYIHLHAAHVHPMVSNDYLNPESVQLFLRGNLRDAISHMGSISCRSGVRYSLSYRTHEIGDQGFVHEILASECRDAGMPSVISFVFLPAMQFSFVEHPLPSFVPSGPAWAHCSGTSYWLALLQVYPQYDRRSFCPFVPRMQHIRDERMLKYRHALRLLLRIGTANHIPDLCDFFVLKGLHFYRLRYSASCDCHLSLATLFIEMLNIHREVAYNEAWQKCITFGWQQLQSHNWLSDVLALDSLVRDVTILYHINHIHLDHLKQLFGSM